MKKICFFHFSFFNVCRICSAYTSLSSNSLSRFLRVCRLWLSFYGAILLQCILKENAKFLLFVSSAWLRRWSACIDIASTTLCSGFCDYLFPNVGCMRILLLQESALKLAKRKSYLCFTLSIKDSWQVILYFKHKDILPKQVSIWCHSLSTANLWRILLKWLEIYALQNFHLGYYISCSMLHGLSCWIIFCATFCIAPSFTWRQF